MNRLSLLAAFASFCSIFTGGGCAAPPSSADAVTLSAGVSPAQARGVPIFRGDGTPATWDEIINEAARADAVLIGENHGHPLGLASAAAIWEDLMSGPSASRAALALEFFERDEQTRIDEYLLGLVDEPTFRKRTLRTSEASYPSGHRAMVEAAKARKRPVLGANAPRPYVRIARTEGWDRLRSLPPSAQALFRIPDGVPGLDNPYRQRFDAIMTPTLSTGHGMPTATTSAPMDPAKQRERLDNGFRSQSLWDWTMGETVVKSIAAGQTPTLLVVGRFHVDETGGLVQAIRHMRPGVRTLVVSFVPEFLPVGGAMFDADRQRGDFIIYVGKQREP